MSLTMLRPRPTQRRYVPDLDKLLRVCERNYHTLCRVLSLAGQPQARPAGRAIGLAIIEADRYTTTISIQEMGTTSQIWMGRRRFLVRIYHDARLAEVLQWHNRRILKGSYPYPNAAMLQRDEKQRVNEFLAEWLCSCARRRLPVYRESPPEHAGAR